MVPTRLGLAASDRLGRHLSDRWSAVASHALAADLGRIGGRFVSAPSKMHKLLLELHAHEQKWCRCFTIAAGAPLHDRWDPKVLRELVGHWAEFVCVVHSAWVAAMPLPAFEFE